MLRQSLVCLSLLAGGCLSANEDPDVRVASKLGQCSNAAAKTGIDSSGKILYASKDSLQMELGVTVVCQGSYEESASVLNDSTVRITYKFGQSASGCLCRKTAVIGLGSAKHDLTRITRADFNGMYFRLKADQPQAE